MIRLINGKQHLVVKRDGRTEPYNPEKLYKVLYWATTHKTNISEENADKIVREILEDINLKIYDKIHITKLFDSVIQTVANKISRLAPYYDKIARNLFMQKLYKETWNIKRDEYPHYSDVLKKGIKYGVYNREVIESFTEEEINELNDYIKPERDFLIETYLGIKTFAKKYAKKYTENKILELPQHFFMRLAIFGFWKEPKDIRMKLIKDSYDIMSQFYVTRATPIALNSMTLNPQMASCVLMQAGDSAESINAVDNALGIFSKYGGGVSVDVSLIRSYGSLIAKLGKSKGKVPFIKKFESTVSAYDQLGSRKGAGIVYYNTWDYDYPELIELKEEGGAEEHRARKLQYGVKMNEYIIEKALNNEDIYLFNPKDTPELLTTYGDEFKKWYDCYSEKSGIRKKKISAIDVLEEFIKQRFETGNIYEFFDENVQEQSMFKEYINSSNLCAEVLLPTAPLTQATENLYKDMSTSELKIIGEKKELGEIALCNLSSVDIAKFYEMSDEEAYNLIYNLLRSMDNLIDYAFYPIKEAEISNKMRRSIGIGAVNYAYFLAKNKALPESELAKELTHKAFEKLAYFIYKASNQLAKERGRPEWFHKTKYADGILPMDVSKCPFNYPYQYDWEELRKEIKETGLRFSAHMAIAPTASSAIIAGVTEGIEFPKDWVAIKTDKEVNDKQLLPELNKLSKWYKLAWDIPNETIIELGAIRQKFIDQSQSLSLYYTDEKGKRDSWVHLKDMIYAMKLGIKTLYYSHNDDNETPEECESCSS